MDNYFDGIVAEQYDAGSPEMFAPEVLGPTVDLLVAEAANGTALELAIGTGRVALPLRERGLDVHGIELSAAMVAQLRAKPGGQDVPVTIGDMTTTRAGSGFGLAYLVFNTINNLTSQDAQVACFRNAAAHLVDGGAFVIEVGMPPHLWLVPGQTHRVFDHTDTHVGIDEYDLVDQVMISHHHSRNGDGGLHRTSIPFRYVWPAELDLMARIAGMRLRSRYAGWDRSPFTAESPKHVSVWERTG
jgi:SAM-dependent methyltransferase